MVEGVTRKIPVEAIIAKSDRAHGGLGELEILAQSIGEIGLINPISVKENEDGAYRVIAGRRRVEAAKMLGWADIEAKVYPADADDEAIALTENVNRQEMHPLDEAEHFKKLLDKFSVKEIAASYDRSAAAIQHRIRLCGLTDDLKAMFREGKLNITGAALIASLPEKDQDAFFKKFQNREHTGIYDVQDFVQRAQRCVLEHTADAECEACKKRTRNTGGGLFDELKYLKDVCFDEDCYCKKWIAKIEILIEEAGAADTESICLGSGIPRFHAKNAKTLSVGGKDYPLLAENKTSFKPTKKKSPKGTAWLIGDEQDGLTARRMECKAFTPITYRSQSKAEQNPVEKFMLDKLPDMTDEERKAAAAKLAEQYSYSNYGYLKKIRKAALDDIISRRVEEGSEENLAALYLKNKIGVEDGEGNFQDFESDAEREFFRQTTGFENFLDIPQEPLLQKVFMFLLASSFSENSLPDISGSEKEWEETKKSPFWKFTGISREDYETLYREKMKAVVAELTGAGASETSAAPEQIPDFDDIGDSEE